jgi:predicted hotdog family 3-hydroxylacyl-ACP dehydratase
MLGRAAIAARIPHAGRMCLLDRVLDWDEKRIRCAALSHRDADNPLREPAGLPVWAGIEYAAQAAAVHGALVRPNQAPRAGMLGALRNIHAYCEWLDRIDGELIVTATLLHGDSAGAIYGFAAHARDRGEVETLLLNGQFTLMLSEDEQGDAT